MNHAHYRIAQGYMKEMHERAYRDHLARTLSPSFKQRLAGLFSTLAARLEPKTLVESPEWLPRR